MAGHESEMRAFYRAWLEYSYSREPASRRRLGRLVADHDPPQSAIGKAIAFAMTDLPAYEAGIKLSDPQALAVREARALEPLVSEILLLLTLDCDWKWGGRRVDSLLWLGTPNAESALWVIAQHHPDELIRGQALAIIGQEVDKPWVIDVLRALAEDPDPRVRGFAGLCLGLRGELGPIEQLVKQVGREGVDVYSLAEAVAGIGEAGLTREFIERIEGVLPEAEQEKVRSVLRETPVHASKKALWKGRRD